MTGFKSLMTCSLETIHVMVHNIETRLRRNKSGLVKSRYRAGSRRIRSKRELASIYSFGFPFQQGVESSYFYEKLLLAGGNRIEDLHGVDCDFQAGAYADKQACLDCVA